MTKFRASRSWSSARILPLAVSLAAISTSPASAKFSLDTKGIATHAQATRYCNIITGENCEGPGCGNQGQPSCRMVADQITRDAIANAGIKTESRGFKSNLDKASRDINGISGVSANEK